MLHIAVLAALIIPRSHLPSFSSNNLSSRLCIFLSFDSYCITLCIPAFSLPHSLYKDGSAASLPVQLSREGIGRRPKTVDLGQCTVKATPIKPTLPSKMLLELATMLVTGFNAWKRSVSPKVLRDQTVSQ